MVPVEAHDELKAYASQLPSLQLSERSVCDLELLATGAFSPLDRFMGRADHQRVLDDMRLANGAVFPMPVILPVDPGSSVRLGQDVALRDAKNELLAVMSIEEIFTWDQAEVAQKVFGTQDLRHPLVAEMHRWGKLSLSGPLQVLQLPRHYDFQELRLTPAQTRARLEALGYANVVAFQTRNPLHRVHEELTKRAAQVVNGVLLLHQVVGLTKPGDVDHYTRVRIYKALVSKGLGFSKEDRDTNIRRIGFVASEIVRHGGVVVCAAVSPYRATRNDVRTMVGTGHFVEVFVDTPLGVCEQRDSKGMYAKARRGEITGFTGIDDPYEAPLHPELTLDTLTHTPEENARLLLHYLLDWGFGRGQVTQDGDGRPPTLVSTGRGNA